MTSLIEVHGLNKSFGAIAVANNIDFSLQPGDRHALIGPNGAGKTTFVNLLAGTLLPDSGSVLFDGADITEYPEAKRVQAGLVRTFQINQLFQSLTTMENVLMAVAERSGIASTWHHSLWRYTSAIDEACSLLGRVGLGAVATKRIKELSYGQQRLVEVAIALALRPKVLMLDEPAAGVPQGESSVILEVIQTLPKDIAVLMIEHDMELVFRFAERITVLVQGTVFASGHPNEIAASPAVRSVYLGEAVHA